MMTYFVCRPEVAAQLRKEFPNDNLDELTTLQILVKNDQVQDAWEFKSHEHMQKYLDGKLTEADLISLSKLN